MTRRVSAIVPVFNEATRIVAQLSALSQTPGIDEVIVVDGGSSDATVALAQSCEGVRVLTSQRGRGPQMNTGAKAATGDVLWFLHADVALPADAPAMIDDALRDPTVVGGAFRIKTVPDGAAGWPARLLWLADLRSRYSRAPYGDQAIFVRRDAFERLGGFAPIPLFEDLDFSRRLRRAGTLRILTPAVQVSGRRFMARPFYYACLMNTLPLLYRMGVPTTVLARIYGHVR